MRLLLPALLCGFMQSGPSLAQDQRDLARLDACLSRSATAPDAAYEDGLIWRREGGGSLAAQCVAVAQIARGDVETGAERLTALAEAPDLSPFQQVAALSRAANAWLLIGRAEAAASALDRAIALAPREPDLLIDRARARALARDWPKVEGDLDQALALRPRDGLALTLRAQARVYRLKLDLAEADVAAALALDPVNETALLVRGHIREARRTGRPPE
jgi:tetratricopeptide (TPR) repeat protein